MKSIPEFAIIGHPNEGKSSVLSTLAEDDTVRISPIPGETTECQSFPVMIDNREIIRFIDTPGFQNPRKTLAWMQQYQGPDHRLLKAFLNEHKGKKDFHDDCQLLTPIAEGAGVIFVVDGSRPVRNVDRAEMEILRLTGAARMAVINSKEEDSDFLADWQASFRKHFNSIRVFNSCKANYGQRIELLESLKGIDQELEPTLKTVITAFERDWDSRNHRTSELIISLLQDTISYKKTALYGASEKETQLKQRLQEEYRQYVIKKEKQTLEAIRALFKHNIFQITLPDHSILQEDLFSARTWEFLGLTDKQIIVAGAMGGAALGMGLDVAAAGISFGVFSALGGLLGAAGTALKGKDFLSGLNLLGMKIGGEQLQVGPVNTIQMLYILLDRTLLLYAHVINWAHGRRDYAEKAPFASQGQIKEGITSRWSSEERKVCNTFFKALHQEDREKKEASSELLKKLILKKLQQLALEKEPH